MATKHYDCIVVGSGHAGSSAALAAVEAGCTSVLILEKAPREWVGGNGYFTAGAHRTVHSGLQDLLPIVRNVTPEQAAKIDIDPYTVDDFTRDIMRLGQNKPDEKLVKTMVEHSREAVEWLAQRVDIPFILSFHRQAYQVNGRQKFWGGLALSTEGGGKGLMKAHMKALEKAGVEISFESPAIGLMAEKGAVTGVVVRTDGKELNLSASSVILAAGGYESSSELRSKHLGSGWEKARVGCKQLLQVNLHVTTGMTRRSGVLLSIQVMALPWPKLSVQKLVEIGQDVTARVGMQMPRLMRGIGSSAISSPSPAILSVSW
jgi:succinate dehydrogenase/fumarate reductase flavoprotein subunit